MNNFWNNWFEAVRFTCEAQNVISARLMLFASSAPDTVIEEATNMVTEKFLAFAKAGIAAERALDEGSTSMPPPRGPTRHWQIACTPTATG